MKLGFSDVIGRHKGSPALVMAHGPSLDKVGSFVNRDGPLILVGCNRWYRIHEDIAPHYWVFANSVNTVASQISHINAVWDKTVLVYADCADLTNRDWVDKKVKGDYLPYDKRHFVFKPPREIPKWPCGIGPCCAHKIPGRLTIQEELMKLAGTTDYEHNYLAGDTIALQCIALSVILGCNPVYVAGMDLDYRLGYAGGKDLKIRNNDFGHFDRYISRILKSLSVIRFLAERIGVRVVNVNQESTFDELEVGRIEL